MSKGLPTLTPLNNANRFDIPTTPSHTSRLPSPNRRAFESDVLLQNLSPEAVLHALRTYNATLPINGSKERVLADSIAETTHHERALAIRAALAGKKLGEWIAELQQWHWPEQAFQPPTDNEKNVYSGSLLATTVVERWQRIESIREDLDLLEMEELKHYVRDIHLQPKSRAVSITSQVSTGSITYNHLADFHVLITAMIVQALPDLLVLSRLLDEWSVRITVSQQIPGFLQQLKTTGSALESAWSTLKQVSDLTINTQFTRKVYQQIKNVLASHVADLARRIDSILDSLEGHTDGIPDRWIDEVEVAESDYKNWVVEAERLATMYEWQMNQHQEPKGGELDAPLVYELADNRSQESVVFHDANEYITESTTNKTNSEKTTLATSAPSATISQAGTDQSSEPFETSTETQQVGNPTSRGLFFMRSPPQFKGLGQTSVTEVQADEASLLLLDIAPKNAARRPAPLNLDTSAVTLDDAPHTDLSALTVASSTGYTDMSSPQIFDASEVQYFKSPHDEYFPVSITRDAEDIPSDRHSSTSRFKHARSVSAVEPMTRSRASSVLSQATITDNATEDETRKSMDQKIRPMTITEQQIQEAQEELDAEPPSPGEPEASPSLRVKKIRIPIDEHSQVQAIHLSTTSTNGHNAKQIEDKMTAKISRLLTHIPAPIKLADHPLPVSETESEQSLAGTNQTQPRQQRSVTPGLTLSPVTSKARTVQPNESGVRVYHLHQPGKDVPIKLFIRLVGSEERVMVRVGGGWADLAEYLKEYAMHHGRRSVSSSNFELKGLPTAQNAASSLFDANRSPTGSATGTPVTSKHGTPNPNRNSFPETPTPDAPAAAVALRRSNNTPDVKKEIIPLSTPTKDNSNNNDDEPSSIGLAGPKTKKVELSPSKKAWVDGMLTQARHISFEHKKPDLTDLGDLGKVGNTKRVFLKGRMDGE